MNLFTIAPATVAECYGDTFRDDEASRNRGWGGEYQAPGF
jgi:hypothetical protein